LIEVPIEEEPELAAFALFAGRFSFSDLLAAVSESRPADIERRVVKGRRNQVFAPRGARRWGDGPAHRL